MHHIIAQKIREFVIDNRYNRIIRKVVQVLACFVIFCTTYALILPGISLEHETFCGFEEHTHAESCYIVEETLSPVIHIHSEECYIQERGELICIQEENDGHFHSGDCWLTGDLLVCSVIENHVHDDSC